MVEPKTSCNTCIIEKANLIKVVADAADAKRVEVENERDKAKNRIVELERLLSMQDEALKRAGSAARFAPNQDAAEKIKNAICFADNGNYLEAQFQAEISAQELVAKWEKEAKNIYYAAKAEINSRSGYCEDRLTKAVRRFEKTLNGGE